MQMILICVCRSRQNIFLNRFRGSVCAEKLNIIHSGFLRFLEFVLLSVFWAVFLPRIAK